MGYYMLGQNQGYTNSGHVSLLVRIRAFQRYMTCLYRHVIYRWKAQNLSFHLAGVHDRVFVYMVASLLYHNSSTEGAFVLTIGNLKTLHIILNGQHLITQVDQQCPPISSSFNSPDCLIAS